MARTQQFANHVYSSMFAAGLHFIQLGDSHFWGIMRLFEWSPSCSTAGSRAAGKPPRGGFIMSHDFVEAAFMRRGGWEVWLAYDLGAAMKRCPYPARRVEAGSTVVPGKFQHIRIAFARDCFPPTAPVPARSHVLRVVLAVVSVHHPQHNGAITEAFRTPVYFPQGRALFPDWPVWHPQWALTLLGTTAIILFMPKLFSILLIIFKGDQVRKYGGRLKLLASLVLEVFLSALFAP